MLLTLNVITLMLSLLIFIACICTYLSSMNNNILCYLAVIYIDSRHALSHDLRGPYWLINLYSIYKCLLQTFEWSPWLYVLDIITLSSFKNIRIPMDYAMISMITCYLFSNNLSVAYISSMAIILSIAGNYGSGF